MKFMDLLFQRYASPFPLLEEMVCCGRFSEFVSEFLKFHNEDVDNDTLWDWYLHHTMLDKSFADFKQAIGYKKEAKQDKKVDFEATLKDSMSILEGFVPEE